MSFLRRTWRRVNSGFAVPWYPLALSAYPVLKLLGANIGEVGPDAALRPLLVSLLLGALLVLFAWLLLHSIHRAAFLGALWLALFFSYGHIYISIEEKFPEVSFTAWLAAGWLVLFLLSGVWVTRAGLSFAAAAPALNTVALALVVMAGWQILSEAPPRSAGALALSQAPVQNDLVRPESPPDVYLFLLDSYGRADLLQQSYGFDNSPFLDELRQRGFYIAECSQSNYVRTELSLASSLNMHYLQALSDRFSPDTTKRSLLWEALKHNAVRYNFESLGYRTITVETGFEWLDIEDSDIFLSPPAISSGMTEFEGLFLRTTLARHVQDWGWVDPDALIGVSSRDRFHTVFNNVDDIARMPEPTFAYLHLISPHPPFVFDAEGKPTYPPDFWNDQRVYPANLYKKGYVNQVQFLNRKILEAVDTILAESETPPVILIQGDHGPWLQPVERRMWILAALYLPGQQDKLYPTLSPVNFFRLVFNGYFGGEYELLEDVSYFSPVPKLYDFSRVPTPCGE